MHSKQYVEKVWREIISIDNCSFSLIVSSAFSLQVPCFAFGLRLELHRQGSKCDLAVRMEIHNQKQITKE